MAVKPQYVQVNGMRSQKIKQIKTKERTRSLLCDGAQGHKTVEL
jgi:hypothetical protein